MKCNTKNDRLRAFLGWWKEIVGGRLLTYTEIETIKAKL